MCGLKRKENNCGSFEQMTLKKYRAAVLAFCMALFLAGCRMQGEATGTEKDDLKGIDIEEKDGKEVYSCGLVN